MEKFKFKKFKIQMEFSKNGHLSSTEISGGKLKIKEQISNSLTHLFSQETLTECLLSVGHLHTRYAIILEGTSQLKREQKT